MKLKNIKRKRLNNKGFTLIELLAVVVILAVVMGIAMTNILSSMNKSRGGSLSDTASVIANGFSQKYTESLVDGVPTSVYGLYDLSASHRYYLSDSLADEFNISTSTYTLKAKENASTAIDTETSVDASFFSFDAATGKFIVCMVANPAGNNYVSTYSKSGGTKVFSSITYTFAQIDSKNAMYACSDGTKSW